MNSLSPSCCVPDELDQLMASAHTVLDQPPPPTLRDILAAYRSKGDGDRDMLLAMLNAKAAEDQRLASIASLQRSVLEIYRASPSSPENHHLPPRSSHHHSSQSLTPSPRQCDRQARRPHHRQYQHVYPSSGIRSPLQTHLQPMRDVPSSHLDQLPRRRRRSSSSYLPPPHCYAPCFVSQREQLPPSPYSSSGRSDSAEYSPHSRPSMAIGSLLTPVPTQNVKG